MLTTVKEKKKSACEESWYTQNGIVKCGCPRRSLPENLDNKPIIASYKLYEEGDKVTRQNKMKAIVNEKF